MAMIGPLLVILLEVICMARSHARNYDASRYDTAYACEGKVLKIECREGELIHLIRANYGRFSITICNDHGNTEWSVNCMSPKSLRVLHTKCSLQHNCSIPASTTMFGDPCPGTLKYLEAHYRCVPATTTTTTSRPSPPWLITSQPSVWSTTKLGTLRPPTQRGFHEVTTTSTSVSHAPEDSVESSPPVGPPPDKKTSTHPEIPISPPVWKTSQQPSTSPSTPVEEGTEQFGSPSVVSSTPKWRPKDFSSQFCMPTSKRNLFWNWTKAGEVHVQPCPGGANGVARWRCEGVAGGDGAWYGSSPDLSECRSVWLSSLDARIDDGDSIINIANDLAQVTNSNTLYGGDMMTTSSIVKKMTDRMSKNVQTFPDPNQREAIVTELLQSVVRTTSNLLDDAKKASWRDLSHAEQMRVATALLIGLEDNAFLLADTVIREKTVVQTVKNILLSVRVIRTQNLEAEAFPDAGERDAVADTVDVPRGAMVDNAEGGLVRIVFIAFQRLQDILLPNDDDDRNTTRIVNSNVISASLGKGRHIQFNDWVRITLRHIHLENVTNPTCVFWDYTTSAWSEEGCRVDLSNRTHTICRCNHLTNFAVLMDVHATYLEPSHQMALQIITYIGCIISIVCLFLALITFHLLRGLKSDRNTIHKNLCMCLLLAEVVFLVGISQTDKPIMCGVVAGLLHFVFLCAFAWMFLEGFQLYVMLIEVFEAEKSRVRWYYLFAYGTPLVIVCVSCVVDPLSYGTPRYCWLRADNFFIFSFVGPVIAVILANLVLLSMAIYMMCRHSTTNVSVKSKEQAGLANARSWLRGAIVLVFLLGLTWTFGLLYLNEESVVMAYIFTILNSLQGLFIFIFHCLYNEKVREEYRKWNSWLPKCVKCRTPREGKDGRSSVYGASGSSGISQHASSGLHTHQVQVPNGNNKIYFKTGAREERGERERGDRSERGGLTVASLHGMNMSACHSYEERAATLGDVRRQAYRHGADRVLVCEGERHNGARAATLHVAKRRRERFTQDARRGEGEDPVYEEIRQAASDLSDEELRRGVASRQSLRSYGDHSPLIPSPQTPHNLNLNLNLNMNHALSESQTPHSLHHTPHSFIYPPRHDR